MDFLDSLDLDTIDKKSHRVRSWYLYEQYKSLERSQLDAAQKLKDRSYQERILRQELSERRARRKLYDQFGLCQSESRLKKSIKSQESAKTSVSASNDDFFESFCDLHEDEGLTEMAGTDLSDDTFSHHALSTTKCCLDDCTSVEDHKDDNSCSGSINSVVENLNLVCENCPQPEDMEFSPKTIADDLNMQLDSIQEDIQCLEEFAKLDDVDKISEDESVNTADDCEQKLVAVSEKNQQEYNNNVIAMWSRLVSFAYQVVQLNHGNCYCDYSSQFLTAVLACDVLRRGVSRMCNILQPYVSPIKFATDDSDSEVNNRSLKNVKRKKSEQSRKCGKICESKPWFNRKTVTKIRCTDRKFSENYWQHPSHHRKEPKRCRRASEPSRLTKFTSKDEVLSPISSSSGSIWHDIFNRQKTPKKHCCCCNKAVNPMLKIAKYIDNLMKDIDDSKHV